MTVLQDPALDAAPASLVQDHPAPLAPQAEDEDSDGPSLLEAWARSRSLACLALPCSVRVKFLPARVRQVAAKIGAPNPGLGDKQGEAEDSDDYPAPLDPQDEDGDSDGPSSLKAWARSRSITMEAATIRVTEARARRTRRARQLGRLHRAVKLEVAGNGGSRAEVFCPHCGLRQSRVANLRRHLQEDRCPVRTPGRLQCPLCPHWRFRSDLTLAIHIKLFHKR